MKSLFAKRCLYSVPSISGRVNQLGIPMIPSSFRDRIFGPDEPVPSLDPKKLSFITRHLDQHNLRRGEITVTNLPDEDLLMHHLPPLMGKNVEDHFQNLGHSMSSGFKNLADSFTSFPSPPDHFSHDVGWTKYHKDGSTSKVPFPEGDFLVLDIETNVKKDVPVMATAVSGTHWFSWISSCLMADEPVTPMNQDHLIPIGTSNEHRLIIGHNVSFDRSYLKEQYNLNLDSTRFLDTMSLHISISGLTGYQRALSFTYEVAKRRGVTDGIIMEYFKDRKQPNPSNWKMQGTLNNLRDVYSFYCKWDKGFTPLVKETRNIFVEGTMEEIKSDVSNLLSYCGKDVFATARVFMKLWPLYKDRFPHPVTLAGMLEMSVMFLPLRVDHWTRYIEESNKLYHEMNSKIVDLLTKLANESCAMMANDQYQDDPWLWDLDWTIQQIRFRKPIGNSSLDGTVRKVLEDNGPEEAIKYLMSTKSDLKKIQPLLPGYPGWFRDFCSLRKNDLSDKWTPGPYNISTQMRTVPKLMKLTWDGFALHHDKKHGWGYLVPSDGPITPDDYEDEDANSNPQFPLNQYKKILSDRNVIWSTKPVPLEEEPDDFDPDEDLLNLIPIPEVIKPKKEKPEFCPSVRVTGCKFYKLPHKDGVESNVGNPLSREFLRFVEDGRLSSFDDSIAKYLLQLNKSTSYWKMNQKRIMTQKVIKSKHPDASGHITGSILPRVVVAGTVTRRAVEPTWLTASNAKKDRIGSEVKSMIRSPEGWKIVGADVDSQELWIASIMGDAAFGKVHGSTGISWMTLQGTKAAGTDMHSVTADLVNITRDAAKVLNYGRIYGAGKRFAARFLAQSDPNLKHEEAIKKAKDIYANTKGVKRKPKEEELFEDSTINPNVGRWAGGTESHMFNALEMVVKKDKVSTPVLGCRVCRPLESTMVKDDFMTSLVNWVVQSSAVDYLHLMLVSMKWMMQEKQIQGRLCISIHDEVRYLIKDDGLDVLKSVVSLHCTNLLCRSFISSKLGIKDLPSSIAFFSAVDVDTVLRKEVDMDSVTLSNPKGVQVTYGVQPGKSYGITESIDELTRKEK